MAAFSRKTIALLLLITLPPIPFPWWGALGRGANEVHAQQATAHCRIHNQLSDGTANVGSGTLIDVTSGGERGLILTCAHLFSEGVGKLLVEFPGGQTHGALLAAVDHKADLAALEIAKPSSQPSGVALELEGMTGLRACGFGSNGQFNCAQGRLLGYSERPGQVSLRMTGAVRSGDSGGGVFDEQGRLCAVVWGESGGVTYASTGRPLAAFLTRVLGSRQNAAPVRPQQPTMVCPDGRCPLVRPAPIDSAPAGGSPAAVVPVSPSFPRTASPPVGRACDCGDKLAAIVARLDSLQRLHGETAPSNSDPSIQAPAGLGGAARAAAALAVTALGISGPAGWGLIGAASIGGWLIGRRRARAKSRRSRAGIAAAPRDFRPSTLDSQEATAVADAAFPIERDDREARELLRLSQLEGRDPLQDAVAGRLALDRLDQIAESDADSTQASWADRLRRELREKFNEIAPTKFSIPA